MTEARQTPSHWWDSLGGLPQPRQPLDGPCEADVAIVGAGYTGLWTAYELKRAAPELEVVVLEREYAGFGASGRNGGWLSGLVAGRRERLAECSGRAPVVAALRTMIDTVGEVSERLEDEGVDCDLVHGGVLFVATNPPQLERLREWLAYHRAWELGEDDWRWLEAGEVQRRVRVEGVLGGLYSPHCARVHPAKLVLGLAAAAERRGATVYERTPVLGVSPSRVVTPFGELRARHVIRATEGYTGDLPGLRRELLPMNSAMIVTEPLGEEIWAELGWGGAEALNHRSHRYCYLQRTADGRIAIGGRGRPYRFGSGAGRPPEIPAATVAELRERLGDLFPRTREAGIARGWAGVLGVPRDWCPSIGLDRRSGLGWAGGYVGDGVAAANLAGRTLRDLVLGRDTELARLPWVDRTARRWEPEPLRYAGVHGLYGLYRLADGLEARGRQPSRIGRVADRLAGR